MPVRVRLTRVGSKKNPIWRVVVADGRSPRDGRFIETVGHYNPQTQPSTIVLDRERVQHWIERGAQPSPTVKKLMRAPDSQAPSPETSAPAEAEAEPTEAAPEPETVVGESEPAEQTEPVEGVPAGAEPPSDDS
jgi:small subunit ribosomal protein S16